MTQKTVYQIPQVVRVSQHGLSTYATVNRTDFNLFKGITNEIDFLVKRADRRVGNTQQRVFMIRFFDYQSGISVGEFNLPVVDESRAHLRLTVKAEDIQSLEYGQYSYAIVEQTYQKDVAVFTDQTHSLRGYFELLQGPVSESVGEIIIDHFPSRQWGNPLLTFNVSDAIVAGMQKGISFDHYALAVYNAGMKGDVYVQASLENGPPVDERDWFDVSKVPLVETDKVKHISLVGNYMWIRVYYKSINDGKVEKVLIRI